MSSKIIEPREFTHKYSTKYLVATCTHSCFVGGLSVQRRPFLNLSISTPKKLRRLKVMEPSIQKWDNPHHCTLQKPLCSFPTCVSTLWYHCQIFLVGIPLGPHSETSQMAIGPKCIHTKAVGVSIVFTVDVSCGKISWPVNIFRM